MTLWMRARQILIRCQRGRHPRYICAFQRMQHMFQPRNALWMAFWCDVIQTLRMGDHGGFHGHIPCFFLLQIRHLTPARGPGPNQSGDNIYPAPRTVCR